jgi:hypothetical protein
MQSYDFVSLSLVFATFVATTGQILVHGQSVLCTAFSVLEGHDELQKLFIHI